MREVSKRTYTDILGRKVEVLAESNNSFDEVRIENDLERGVLSLDIREHRDNISLIGKGEIKNLYEFLDKNKDLFL